MPRLTLYTGPDCSLCEKARALIEKVAADVPFTLETVNVREDVALLEAYRERIPVIALDGEVVLEGKVTEFWLRKALAGEPLSRHRLF